MGRGEWRRLRRQYYLLNAVLKRHALNAGSEWTEDIATLRWRPDPQYYDPREAERMRHSYEELEYRYGVSIAMPSSVEASTKPCMNAQASQSTNS